MAYTLEALKNVAEDIKHSWYFRLWAALWIFCAVFVFAVLIVLGNTSTQALDAPTFKYWTENVTTMEFPRFHLRLSNPNDSIIGLTECYHYETTLQTEPCAIWNNEVPDLTRCQAIASNNVVAKHIRGDDDARTIYCYLNVNVSNPASDNQLIAFELEGSNIATYGANSYASIWIAPNNNAWVLLNKAYISFAHKPTQVEWERELVYHSTITSLGFYVLSIKINRFQVVHAEQVPRYNGWMALGEIGGFAYFLVLLHILFMALVGICLNNDARTLQGSSADQGSSEEKRAIIR
jgi:hypothetical protein